MAHQPKPNTEPKGKGKVVVATHRKARHDYFVQDTLEAGISLVGSEVKSLRDGKADLLAGFATIHNNQAWLHDVHIRPYEYAHAFNHEPRRKRRLLLHKREIAKLFGKVQLKGMTLIPLSMYFNARGKVKVELGLCQGKHTVDKRETLKKKDADREAHRALAR